MCTESHDLADETGPLAPPPWLGHRPGPVDVSGTALSSVPRESIPYPRYEPFADRPWAGPPQPGTLTAFEIDLLLLLTEVQEAIVALAPDPPTRTHDIDDACAHVRALQRIVLAQSAHRAYPREVDPFGGRPGTPEAAAERDDEVEIDDAALRRFLGTGTETVDEALHRGTLTALIGRILGRR